MKKIIGKTTIISILMATGLFLFSCYFTNVAGKGSVSLKFFQATPKAAKATGTTTYARVFLLANGEIYPIGNNTDYIETSLANTGETEIEISDIPAGPQYEIAVSLGTKNTSGQEYIYVSKYGVSGPFSIVPGGTVNISLTTEDSPFSLYLGGVDLKGVVYDTGTLKIYTVSENQLYFASSSDQLSDVINQKYLPDGYTANSISLGKFFGGASPAVEPWINTNKGILPYRNSAFVTDFSNGSFSSGTKPSILQSGGVWAGSDLTVFYQRDGGLGGTYITSSQQSTPGDWDWLDIDLSDILTGKPILDFFVTDNFAYFATKLGSFRLSADMIKSYNNDTSSIPDLMNYANFFYIKDENGNNIPVLSLAGYYDGTTHHIVMGTENGAYIAELRENPLSNDVLVSAPTEPLQGTAGKSISKISVSPDAQYIALFSENDLFVYRKTTEKLKDLPFYAGLPGTITGAAWTDNTTLVISGSYGLAELDVSTLGL